MRSRTEYTALAGDEEKGIDLPKPVQHGSVMRKAGSFMWNGGDNLTSREIFVLRVRTVLATFFLVLGKMAGLVTPIILKLIVDDLTEGDFPWHYVILYGLGRFGAVLCSSLQDVVFSAVSAAMERAAAMELFNHLQHLSLAFHVNRETGSVLRSVSRGASSFGMVVRVAFFNIAPVGVQVLLVCSYLLHGYHWSFAVLTFGIITAYFVYTLVTTEWRNKFRREMNAKDNKFNQRAVDALLNFETVKYFNAEEHEARRYDTALKDYRDASIVSQQTLAVLNCGQEFVISVGVAGALYLAGTMVLEPTAEFTIGDFVMIQQFIMTLYAPLGFLGTYYRMLKQSIIDIESMMQILSRDADIIDYPGASELHVSSGRIAFEDVHFSYDKRTPLLKGISFSIESGQSVAIVGATGAGKSTLGKLLYRFYDVDSGCVTVDGQDIRQVTQDSLRKYIGIVPQDCVLFNDTIGYNIGYGMYARRKTGATQEEIEAASIAASIDEFIRTQPNGYDTAVGERGLRLSGGEKQRVAIARAILKAPKILVFDGECSRIFA